MVKVNPLSEVTKLWVTCALLIVMGSEEDREFEIFVDDAVIGAPGSVCPPLYFDTARTVALPPGIRLTSRRTLSWYA